jgi:Hypoxia induced protein conserved region
VGLDAQHGTLVTMVKIVVAVGVGVVVCILFAGIYTLWVGGDVSRTWSNKLMRIRVLAQFVVIIIIMTALWLTSHH